MPALVGKRLRNPPLPPDAQQIEQSNASGDRNGNQSQAGHGMSIAGRLRLPLTGNDYLHIRSQGLTEQSQYAAPDRRPGERHETEGAEAQAHQTGGNSIDMSDSRQQAGEKYTHRAVAEQPILGLSNLVLGGQQIASVPKDERAPRQTRQPIGKADPR